MKKNSSFWKKFFNPKVSTKEILKLRKKVEQKEINNKDK